MKSAFITLGYRILHYLYLNRKTVYSIAKKYYKTGDINGELSFNEFLDLVKIVKDSGLKKGDDDKIPVGSDYVEDSFIDSLPANAYKELKEYKQKGPTCAIYSMGRTVGYNTGIITTQNEVEEVAGLARDLGYLDKNGMKFIDSGKVWTQWIKTNKNADIEVLRVPMYGPDFNKLVSKGYSYVTGGAITNSFFFEREDDGIVDITKIDWNDKTEYYHAWSGESIEQFTDNFAGAIKYNRFINKYHPEFIRRGKFFSWAYFPVLKEKPKDYETISNENAILRRRADEAEKLAKDILKTLKPNDYKG